MNFKQLNKTTQLSIISELSGVKIQAMGFRHTQPSSSNVMLTGLAADLEKYGLSTNVLTNPHDGQVNLVVNVTNPTPPGVISGMYSPSCYLSIGRHLIRTAESKLVIAFGSSFTSEEANKLGLTDAMVSGRIIIEEDDDIRDLLTAMITYIGSHTTNTDVITPALQLIEGYNKALTLPDDLIERIANWTSITKIIDSLTTKITHNYSNYYAGDEGDDGYQVPTPRGRNIFNVERKFGRSGFTVAYDQHAEEFTGHQVDVEYTPDSGLEAGRLKVSLTYRGLDNIVLGETKLKSDMTADTILDTIVDILNSVKLNGDWGAIVTPLVDHVTGVVTEVKPFIIATLK